MSIEASTRFTAARTMSNAAPSASMASSLRKRESIQLETDFGTYLPRNPPASWVARTMLRAAFDDPNISSPSSWRDRSTLVFITFCAFFDVVMATIITRPAISR